MRAQAYLTHESATNLARETEVECGQKVVVSASNGAFKFLEEVAAGDYVMDPHVKLTPGRARRMSKIIEIHNKMKNGLNDIFFGIGSAISFFSFLFWVTMLLEEQEWRILVIPLAVLSLGAGLISTPFFSQKAFRKVLKKCQAIEFPELLHKELGESNITHEQLYEIARIGAKRSKLKEKIYELNCLFFEKDNQIKSTRVLKEIEQLMAQRSSLEAEVKGLTEEIAAIVASSANEAV